MISDTVPEVLVSLGQPDNAVWIKVSTEVLKHLQALATPFEDSADDVLRRALHLPATTTTASSASSTSTQHAASTVTSHPLPVAATTTDNPPSTEEATGKEPPDIAPGDPTTAAVEGGFSRWDFRSPVIRYLQQQPDGTSTRPKTLDALLLQFGQNFEPSAFEDIAPGHPRWKHAVDGVIKGLRTEGIVAPAGFPQGVWQLTEKGMTCDPEQPKSRRLLSQPRLAGEEGVPRVELMGPVITSLQELNGSASPRHVIDAAAQKLGDRLTPRDLEVTRRGRVRWEDRCHRLRSELIEVGIMSDSSVTGLWELTEEGMNWRPDDSTDVLLDGSALLMREYQDPILRCLQAVGGTGTRNYVYTAVRDELKDRFQPVDYASTPSGGIRWERKLDQARALLVDRGLIARSSPNGPAPRGMWVLTAQGMTHPVPEPPSVDKAATDTSGSDACSEDEPPTNGNPRDRETATDGSAAIDVDSYAGWAVTMGLTVTPDLAAA